MRQSQNRVTFSVSFYDEEVNCERGSADLTVDLPFAPSPHIEYYHPAFEKSLKPACVDYDIEAQSFFVKFPMIRLQSTEDVKTWAEMYRQHGWTVAVNFGPNE